MQAKGIIGSTNGMELVDLQLLGEIAARASHIGDSGHHMCRQLPLDAQTPLLHKRPNNLGGDGCDADGEAKLE